MPDKVKMFLDRVHSVVAGEAADKMFDQVSQGIGVLSAIYFLLHKLSGEKIGAILNEDLVASLLTFSWSDSTTDRMVNELSKRKHFLSWYMIYLSESGLTDLKQTAFDEMTRLARTPDEMIMLAKCSHPLLSQNIRDGSREMVEKFFDDFLMLPEH